MASFYNKFLDFIGIEESEELEDDRRDDGYFREERQERSDRGDRSSRNDNVVTFGGASQRPAPRQTRYDRSAHAATGASGANLPISGGMKMIVYHPVSYEDTQIVIDNLKNRKPVIVNMEELEMDCAQRILDLLTGAVYALNGTMCKISRGIFVVAPNNYDVVGNGDDYSDL